ncbi:DUF4097 domain-containing protein [Alkalihalobacillus sp. MEB130]|uniref:DUF4097 family beta strand repeat-containing protein n=1 Tax=Alkalihalobacillus sp. MEB130 TaxID=2976704 RepID=UPI0028DDAF0C|nr:DUF4097 family beta strand repeat-containing protein [Alkalihalobacillus sp. MEB130]MDT8862010.1 DUF4097 domain-containing protein [Alkalihalobacillus sp. MEB130]
MKVFLGIILIVVGLLLLVTTISLPFTSSQKAESGSSLTADMSNVKTLDLSSTSVDWVIQEHDSQMLKVELSKQDKQVKLIKKENNETIEIEVKEPRFRFFSFNFSGKGQAIVYLPVTYKENVIVNSVSGTIELKNDRNLHSLTSQTVSGNIVGSNVLVDSFQAKTTSGRIQFKDVASNLTKIESVSGDVQIDQMSGELDTKTVSGNVDIGFKEENENTYIKTVSGDVRVNLPVGNADLKLTTVSGDLRIDHTLQQQSVNKRSLTGIIGDGLYPVTIATTSGDIILHER